MERKKLIALPPPPKKTGTGGKREGSGRPARAPNKFSRAFALEAKKTGVLPHVFLLNIMRTGTFKGKKVDLAVRIECAKAAAPYFAPRFANLDVRGKVGHAHLVLDEKKMKHLTEEQLDILGATLAGLGSEPGEDTEGKAVEADENLFAAAIDGEEGGVAS